MGSRSYPIWNQVQACIYKGGKSWGARENCSVHVKVGTSSSNSHSFVSHCTTHRTHKDGSQEFRFFVDGQVVKKAIIAPKRRKSDCVLEFVGVDE